MRAEKDSVVSFHYIVRDAADAATEPYDDSRKRGEPLLALLTWFGPEAQGARFGVTPQTGGANMRDSLIPQ